MSSPRKLPGEGPHACMGIDGKASAAGGRRADATALCNGCNEADPGRTQSRIAPGRLSAALAALALSRAALAADAAQAPQAPVSFAPGLLQATLGLAVVLALIWGAARLARRFSPMATTARSPIKVVATQALGQRERVVLVEVGDNWLLLGVAPGQVNALHTLPKSTLPPPATIDDTPFGKLLARARGQGRDA